MSSFFVVIIRVFKPGSVVNPVQGPSSGLWPGYQVVRVNSDFFKNKNDIILVKKKVNGLQPGFWLGQSGQPSHPRFWLPLFFLNSTRFQLQVSRVSNQLTKSDRISKLWFLFQCILSFLLFLFQCIIIAILSSHAKVIYPNKINVFFYYYFYSSIIIAMQITKNFNL